MANEIIITCRKVVAGKATGSALVSTDPIAGWRSLDEENGYILERNHCHHGQSIKNRVLVFPFAKGSSGWSQSFHNLALNGGAPAAILIRDINAKSALGVVLMKCPTVTDFSQDPWAVIETGDTVEVNADEGYVKVYKKE